MRDHVLVSETLTPAILLRTRGSRIIKVGLLHILTGRRREASGDNMCHRYGSGTWLSTPSDTSGSWPVTFKS